MILRSATPDDITPLARLGRESFIAKFAHLYRPEDLGPFLEATYSETAIAAEMANPQRLYQLAERDSALIGYAKLSLACGWGEYARGDHVIELKQLYTAPDVLGRGIGTALMDWAMATARAQGADEMQLSVWSRNHDAQRFYARYGFTKQADVTFRVGEQLDEEFLFAVML